MGSIIVARFNGVVTLIGVILSNSRNGTVIEIKPGFRRRIRLRWGGTNSGTNNPEKSAFFQSEVVRRFFEHTTSDLRLRCVSG